MTTSPDIDFARIAARGGSQDRAFEELCCQLALAESGDSPSFRRVRGDGGDGGVECFWTDAAGDLHGWQVKYMFDLATALKKAADSLATARKNHPAPRRYAICVPFDLAGSKGFKGKGRTQQEKFATFKAEKEEEAKSAGHPLTVELISASLLRDRLLRIDPSGGRRRYWFDDAVLGRDWFAAIVNEAFRRAGPRYKPELHHGHALDDVLAALGDTESWRNQRDTWVQRLRPRARLWTKMLEPRSPNSWVGGFPGSARAPAEALSEVLHSVVSELVRGGVPVDLADRGLTLVTQCSEELAGDLDQQHGAGAADSPTFRHRQSELHGHLPAGDLDACRDLQREWRTFVEWARSPAIRANAERTLLVVGPAGIGKTHGLCDGAKKRLQAEEPTVLVAGAQLGGDRSLDECLVASMGLGSSWTRDQLLDALDAAGAAAPSGRALLIIDALDERNNRGRWLDDLPVLIAAVRQRPRVALCVSVRDAYRPQVIRSDVALPELQHPGFGDAVFEACSEFFRFHDLEPPVGPLLEPELGNPLFLRVVCDTLRGLGSTTLPSGWRGVRQLFDRLLGVRDEALRQDHPGVGGGAVTRALGALAAALPDGGALPWNTADEIVTATLPVSQRGRVDLLVHLLGLGLVRRSPDASGTDQVDLAFGRLRHHLLADRYTQPGVSSDDELRRRALDDPGLADALALVMPERGRGELFDLATSPGEEHELMMAWLGALPWRGADTVTERCEELVRMCLREPDWAYEALDALVTLAIRPGHRLDHEFLHELLGAQPMPRRDQLWCGFLYDAFERSSPPSPLVRLLRAPWETAPASVPEPLLTAWLLVLGWCGAAADRRVRDAATKAAVRLSEPRPGVWAGMVERFADVDDDSVLERVVCAAYGALLRNPAPDALARVAMVVRDRVLRRSSGAPSDALVRVHAQGIGEWANHRGALAAGVRVTDFRPPHARPIRLEAPTEADLRVFDDHQNFPRLFASVMGEWTGDFSKYTIPYALGGYRDLLPHDEACRFVLAVVIQLGYSPDLHAPYDHHMLRTYGYGRGKPAWAERIGKKYQRIALGRLVGLLDDHGRARGLEVPAVAGASLRDLDPSLLQREASPHRAADHGERWWSPVEWSFAESTARSDEDWVGGDDFPDPAALVGPLVDDTDPGRPWRLLGGYFEWEDSSRDRETQPFRQIWVKVTGYLVPRRNRDAVWWLLARKDFWGQWMPEGGEEDHRLFVGEFPWAPHFPELRNQPDAWDERAVALQKLGLRPAFTQLTRSGDAWQEGTVSIDVPCVELAEAAGARWDGVSGFRDGSGRTVYRDPSVTGGGPSGVWADDEILGRALERLDAEIVWTAISERRVMSLGWDDTYRGSKHVSWTMRQARGRVEVRRGGGEYLRADSSRGRA